MADIYKQNMRNLHQALDRYLDPDQPRNCYDVKRIIPDMHCDFCGESMREGGRYLDFCGTWICDDCLDSMSGAKLVETLELEMEEVQ